MLKECKTAIFNFQECDSDLIEILAKYLDDNTQKIWDFFELQNTYEKAKINIIPTKKEYDDEYKKARGLDDNFKLAGWMIGNCHNGIITYLSLHDFKNTTHAYSEANFDEALEYYKKTILHEYVHFVNEKFNLFHNCTYTEKYLVEGIATYLSGQKDGFTLSLKASKEDLIDKNKALYSDYYLVTKYFVENYDKDYVLEVFQSNRQARELLNHELYENAKKYYENENGQELN